MAREERRRHYERDIRARLRVRLQRASCQRPGQQPHVSAVRRAHRQGTQGGQAVGCAGLGLAYTRGGEKSRNSLPNIGGGRAPSAGSTTARRNMLYPIRVHDRPCAALAFLCVRASNTTQHPTGTGNLPGFHLTNSRAACLVNVVHVSAPHRLTTRALPSLPTPGPPPMSTLVRVVSSPPPPPRLQASWGTPPSRRRWPPSTRQTSPARCGRRSRRRPPSLRGNSRERNSVRRSRA